MIFAPFPFTNKHKFHCKDCGTDFTVKFNFGLPLPGKPVHNKVTQCPVCGSKNIVSSS